MKEKLSESVLDRLVDDVVKKRYVFGAVFCVSTGDGDFEITSASGEMRADSQYYIASINKFFLSALILKLYAENTLDIEDTISKYLPADLIRGLHVYDGREYSNTISIAHLLSLTSGLPCYLADQQINGKTAMKELESGMDQAWPIDKVIQEVKKMKPHFPPGERGRAKYGDTNHHLLTLIVEEITGQSTRIALKNVFDELHMKDTYVYDDPDDKNFVPIRYKSDIVHLPIFLTSTQYDIISTAKDQMIFLKAFFHGHFFPRKRFCELEKWNRIFFPFAYGVGIQKFQMPRFLSPFQPVPEMIGHCGSTGSVAFYVPDMDVYITGTTNQQAKANVAFQAMIKMINKIR